MKTEMPIQPAKLTTLEFIRAKIKKEIAQKRNLLKSIGKIRGLDKLHLEPSTYQGGIDFDCLKRPDVEKVLRHVGGKWAKSPNDNATVDYSSEQHGIRIRMWRGEPPPQCKVVQVERFIPAHTEMVRELVCPKGAVA